MKSLQDYIKEEKDDISSEIQRGDIKFTIWEEPDKKVVTLKDNEHFQKIEYKYNDKESNISIDFLLGFQENSWKLWIGKIGSCSYDDDPYCSFDTDNFKKAIVLCLDKVEEFIKLVKDEPDNYVQFYIHR